MMKENKDMKENHVEKPRFIMKYKETKDVLVDTLQLYGMSRVQNNYRLIVALVGVCAIIMYVVYEHPFGGNPGANVLVVVKILVIWVLAFVLGEVLSRTLGKKLELVTSLGDATQMYSMKIDKMGQPLDVTVKFYEDTFVSSANHKSQGYRYEEVMKLVESPDTIGIAMHLEGGQKPFYGYPKEGLVDADIEELKSFLINKCPKVEKGFEFYAYQSDMEKYVKERRQKKEEKKAGKGRK